MGLADPTVVPVIREEFAEMALRVAARIGHSPAIQICLHANVEWEEGEWSPFLTENTIITELTA